MELNEAIKILNLDNIATTEEMLEAIKVFFKRLFNVDIKNSDGSYKSMYSILEESSKNLKK